MIEVGGHRAVFVPRDRVEEALSLGAEFRPGTSLMAMRSEHSISERSLSEFLDYDARLRWVHEAIQETAPLPFASPALDDAGKRHLDLIPLHVPRFRRRDARRLPGVRWVVSLGYYASDGTGAFAGIAEFLTPRMECVAAIDEQMRQVCAAARGGRFSLRKSPVREKAEPGAFVFPPADFEAPLDTRSGEMRPRIPRRAMSEEQLEGYAGLSGPLSYRSWIERRLSESLGFPVDFGEPAAFFERLDKSAPREPGRLVPLYVCRSGLDEARNASEVSWSRRNQMYLATPRAKMSEVRQFLTIRSRLLWRAEKLKTAGGRMAIRAGAMQATLPKPPADRSPERDILEDL